MTSGVFPLDFATDDLRLLTGLVIGFGFGFVLERAGFGNARKLAGQFYLNDMTVFKVMFSAILVAMVGLYGLASLGMVDMSLVWVSPTFIPAQAVGGFLLGIGFIMSGLCPGTSVVSMVSGRIDGWVTFVGIFLGIALFAFTVDRVPGLQALYLAGSGEVSLLHEILGVPALVLALIMVAGAVVAFVGVEKVEAIFQAKRRPVELTPASRPRLKLAMGGSLATLAIVTLTAGSPGPPTEPVAMTPMAALTLAENIIEREPGILIVDLRSDPGAEKGIPGAVHLDDGVALTELLRGTPEGTLVVTYDEDGRSHQGPPAWPRGLEYRFLEGGLAGWRRAVLTPASLWGNSQAERDRVQRQNQISAFFSGAAVQSSSVAAPPPVMPAGGGGKKPKAGGC
ncbi:MAG: YeeE/YedE family protein [Gemmatimonadetes bacterium]|nr:YeeE/YedE family protein [Gemmatimonadota bacterium]